MTQRGAAEPDVPQQNSEETFDRLVEEGEQRLGLVATGFLGGLDVGVGVLALLLVEHATHSVLEPVRGSWDGVAEPDPG